MKRTTKMRVVLLLLAGLLAQTAAAQDSGETLFARNLVQSLHRLNWEASEIGELERYLYQYEWKNLTGVDPSIVAQALSYGREHGLRLPEELAETAYQLSLGVSEMVRLGFKPREALRAVTAAVRTMTAERVATRTGEHSPDLSQTLREQLRRQITGSQESSLQRQATRRISRPDRSDTWTPPAPQEKPGEGEPNIPSGPGKPSGSETSNGNGGR